jgi:hypothetical protein
MRGLINPMLSYYWANAGRELEINISSWNISASSPTQIAVAAATHGDPRLRNLWSSITYSLAQVNPGLLHRVSDQILLDRAESPDHIQVAEQIRRMLPTLSPVTK